MIQNILTYTVVSLAFLYTLYKLIRIIIPKKNETKKANGCSGSCNCSSTNQKTEKKVLPFKIPEHIKPIHKPKKTVIDN